MTLIPTPLPASGPPVTALQNALSALGFGIPSGELGSGDNGVFGPVTRAAVDTFRAHYGLPPIVAPASPFDASAARLINAVVSAEVASAAVQSAAVRESIAAAQGAPAVEVEWLARYATIARDFAAARQALPLAPDDAALEALVGPIVGDATFQSPHPELQNPENYFT